MATQATTASPQKQDPRENKEEISFTKKDPYPDLMAEILSRLAGKYAVFSLDTLAAMKRDDEAQGNPASFVLTKDLLAKCVLIQKQAFQSSNSDEFRAGITIPIPNPSHSTPPIFIEIRYRDRIVKKEDELLIAEDLIEAFCPKEGVPAPLNAALLAKCIFVAKSIFDPKNHAKFHYEIASDECVIIRDSSRLNKTISELTDCMRTEIDPDDEEVLTVYSIGRV